LFPKPLRTLAVLALCLVLAGCAVIEHRERQLEAGLQRAGLQRQTLQLGSDTVHFWEGGSGPAVLLLHGFGASAIWQWHPQISALAPGHRVIVPDLLWFGGSASSERDFGLAHQVRAVEGVLEHLGIEQTDVVGISYGGLVAWALAAARPEQVRRLVLLDSPGPPYTRQDYAALLQRMGASSPGDFLVPAERSGVQELLEIAYRHPPSIPASLQQEVLDTLYAAHRDEKVALLEEVVANLELLRDGAGEVRAPTLLIWGDEDPVFPLEIGQRLEQHLGESARLEVIARARHAPNIEHPAKVNRLLLGFLDGPEPGSGD